jgi:hypothetical protein
MDLQKLNVKFFVEPPDTVPLTEFIEVFHSWIQATDGDYHDVADYSHMQDGPGIVLIANDANVSIDESGGRRGLLYNRKAPLAGSNQERLRTVIRAGLENCRRLQREPALAGKMKFSGDGILISVNDRLAVPNTRESLESLKPDLEAFAGRLFDWRGLAFSYETDSRQRFSVAVRAPRRLDLDRLIANVDGESC